MALTEIHLKITGMTCGHCERTVSRAIHSLDGIISASADHRSGVGIVVMNDVLVSVPQILAAVEDTGVYHAELLAA